MHFRFTRFILVCGFILLCAATEPLLQSEVPRYWQASTQNSNEVKTSAIPGPLTPAFKKQAWRAIDAIDRIDLAVSLSDINDAT